MEFAFFVKTCESQFRHLLIKYLFATTAVFEESRNRSITHCTVGS